MVRQIYFAIYLTLFLYSGLNATTISGRVTDADNQPLPFCNIFIQNTGFACASNEQGYYTLQVTPGNYAVTFQFIGYKKQEINLNATTNVVCNVIMELEYAELDEVVINSDQEDPAYAIMRKAIELRPEHLQEINTYSCDVYIKGLQKLTSAPDKILGIQLNTILDVDSNNTGVIYLSESSSTFNYKYPDKTKEVMHASIVSGDDSQFSWNDAASMHMNFYTNLETLEGFSQRGFVSPVADNALFFYEYSLLGQSQDHNHTIYKIAVNPKRKSDPAYSGIIYITDDDYRLSGLQLHLTKDNGIDFIDTFIVSQSYYYADDEHLVLKSNKFDFNYNFFGIQGNGYFHAIYNNYTVNLIFPKNFFNGEVSKIEENANKKDSLYWNTVRPIQLTDEETRDYIEKDSLAIIKENPAYKDSVDRIFNRFNPTDLISGYTYRNSNDKIFLSTNPLPDLLQFNTVEGYVINPKMRLTKWFENKDEINFSPGLRYGFGSKRLYANASLSYDYDKVKSASVTITGGSGVQQYNKNGIVPIVNSFYSLLLEENFLKIYEQYYAGIKTDKELINGLYGNAQMYYYQRNTLENLPDVRAWIDTENQQFDANNYPFYTDSTSIALPDKFYFQLGLKYAIGQQYYMQPGEKFVTNVKYPILNLTWEKAIPGIFNSNVAYDIIKFGFDDNYKLALAGNLTLDAEAGILFSDSQLNIADQLNFAGNETIIQRISPEGYFLLPYYYAATENYFAAAHIQWHTEGFLFRQLPLFKQLKLEPVFSANYLYTDELNHYLEIAAGVEHLFKIIRVDIAYTPYTFENNYPAENIKVLIGFGF